LTQNQLSSDYLLAWLREVLQPEFERYECGSAVSTRMEELDVSLMDVIFALRNSTVANRDYEGGCFTVRGIDLDERKLSIVVAPPSEKNRVRVVKVWIGD
jgi:hypothetical protein